MRLKSFYAKTMTDAMQMVRDSLGEDAIIVATREEGGGASVRVTAAVDNDAYQGEELATGEAPTFYHGNHDRPSTPAPEPELGRDDNYPEFAIEDEDGAIFETLTDICLRHSIPEDVTDQIVASATVMGLDESRLALVGALESLYSFKPVDASQATHKPLMMVGAPGAGKTMAVAKGAAQATMNGLGVAVITTDTKRAGGVEQLKALTDVMGLELHRVTTPEELKQAITHHQATADQCIIDTAGVNPFDKDQVRELAGFLGAGAIEPMLVLPAGADPGESGDIGRIFATIGVKRIIATRLDVTRRVGGLLAAAHQGDLQFANASNTPQVAEGMLALSPRKLAAWLMPEGHPPNATKAIKTAQKTG
jgi:flagellar biosynthesis protein FlhF